MSAAEADLLEKMRITLLAEFRVSLIKLRLAETNIELIGTALKNHLITPDQAMAMAYERGAMAWLFRDRERGT